MDATLEAVCGQAGLISFWDAWEQWRAGHEVKDCTLWGQKIIFWARLGKLLQFTAGLVVVLDLVGPERIQQVSDRIARFATRRAQHFHPSAKNKDSAHDPHDRYVRFIDVIARVVVWAGAIFVLVWTVLVDGEYKENLDRARAAQVYFMMFVAGFNFVAFPYAYRALAWLVARGKNYHIAQWVAVVLAAAGFLFDLLGS